MNSPPKKPATDASPGATDDPSIPVLTDRLGFPPLDFDTTLPTIDSALVKFGDTDLGPVTVQPIEPAGASAPTSFAAAPRSPATTPSARTYPTGAPGGATPRAAPRPGPAQPGVGRVYGGSAVPPLGHSTPVPAASAPAMPTGIAAAAAPNVPGPDNPVWARMEGELRNAILRGLAERLPNEVELTIRTQMNPVIDRLIETLVAETRKVASASVRQIVEQTLRAELERMRSPTRGSN